MRLVQEKENQVTFEAEIDDTLANSLRRLINHIPTMAVDEVEISKNDSPLYDETIAHRIGLIPLKNPKNKKTPEIKLIQKGKGFVYSKDLEGDVKIVFDKIPITYLEEGKELKLSATTKFGVGKEHSKFSPGFMFYRNVYELNLEKDIPLEMIKLIPPNAINNKTIIDENIKNDLVDVCSEINKELGHEFVKIVQTNKLLITVESFGQIEPKEIFMKSIEVLKDNLKNISKVL